MNYANQEVCRFRDDTAARGTIQYDAKFDGKDYPVTGLPNADTVSVKRIDANTIQSTLKKTGQGGDDRDIDGLQLQENAHFDIQGQGRPGA